jgi:hypothetical protein
MKAKHTPAPWHTGGIYPEDVYANRAGHAIARCVNEQYEGECEANARLIAAAPELLEELEKAMYYMTFDKGSAYISVEYMKKQNEALKRIKALIAKATEEST